MLKEATPKTTYLKDYHVPPYLVDLVDLTIQVDLEHSVVQSTLTIRKNEASEGESPLILDGEQLELRSIALNGESLPEDRYYVDEKQLTIPSVPDEFTLEIENVIHPLANSALEGIYASGEIICSQCESQGFRRITYFIDRPDVMSRYRVRLIGNKKRFPVMLSNGNYIGSGTADQQTHWVQWEDPFPKPCYLFAVVAGDLGRIDDRYTTASGREVALKVYCDKGNEERCRYAMEALKKAMKWDEEVYGLEYDLDLFMIVAVDAFNFGAMENKGLNIFNTSCVLADPESATDDNYLRVEGVVAHEYFHNWTGNRITCRDWFQLTLKEGLTVFRDQQFSADMNSAPVQRVQDVAGLRQVQFLEDAGPTAHPIKPDRYIQINNFYTPTVYRKGAEVIRMIHTLIGPEVYRRGIDKYFELFDGQAVTTEDFIHAMTLGSGRDFEQFSRWYSQAGTPHVDLSFNYDPDKQQFLLQVKQWCDPTADGSAKEPFLFPLAVGLVGSNGDDLEVKLENGALARQEGSTFFLEISQPEQQFLFSQVTERPVCSANRNFSAPVIIHAPYSEEESLFLMAHDPDPFNRWDAGNELCTRLMIEAVERSESTVLPPGINDAFEKLLIDDELELSLKSMALTLPSETLLGQRQKPIRYDENHTLRESWMRQLAERHRSTLLRTYEKHRGNGDYSTEPTAVGSRRVANCCLGYLSRLADQAAIDLSWRQYEEATNMTDRFAALHCLAQLECPEREAALSHFYDLWKHDSLVMCKWFSVQAGSKLASTVDRVRSLTQDPVYNIRIPNLVRALWGSFGQNHAQFNRTDGSGYQALADAIIELDPLNPQIASRLSEAFRRFGNLDNQRRQLMQPQLERILELKDLSSHTYEMISKILRTEKAVASQQ